jgi:hypothetical protein
MCRLYIRVSPPTTHRRIVDGPRRQISCTQFTLLVQRVAGDRPLGRAILNLFLRPSLIMPTVVLRQNRKLAVFVF